MCKRQTEAALTYDAVGLIAHALSQLEEDGTRLRMVNLSCDADAAWMHGTSFYNYMNMVRRYLAY